MTRAHSRTEPSPALGQSADYRMVFVDAHVHLHRRFDLACVFDHAAANVARAATARGFASDTPGVLMLAESAGVDRFGELARRVGQTLGQWQLEPCDENESLRLWRTTQHTLFVIAGRQIVTSDRLEVLALGTRRRIDNGKPTGGTIQEVRRAGALPVLPWGFGKWTGRRRRVVQGLLESPVAGGLFLGDNGGRPRQAAVPRLFHEAWQRGVRLLPGTDPLPFAHQQRRAGRYGFMLPLRLDERRPSQAIHDLLLNQPGQPAVFGERDGWLIFTAAQLAMQWHNRTRRRR